MKGEDRYDRHLQRDSERIDGVVFTLRNATAAMELLPGGFREYMKGQMEHLGVSGFVWREHTDSVQLVARCTPQQLDNVEGLLREITGDGYIADWCRTSYTRNVPGQLGFIVMRSACRLALGGRNSPTQLQRLSRSLVCG